VAVIIDATRRVLGRMASEAAKKALMGEEVIIINADRAYVSGSERKTLEDNMAKAEIKNKGNVNRGPYHPKRPDNYVRKSIRGMLPYKTQRGKLAYKRVRVYIGAPEDKLIEQGLKIPSEPAQKEKKLRRKITVAEICKHLGGRWE
jgi:large subunit ribosomal protein L13